MATVRPAGNSVAAITRRLARYAESPDLCRHRGVDHAAVTEALRRFRARELSAAAALTAAGLVKAIARLRGRLHLLDRQIS